MRGYAFKLSFLKQNVVYPLGWKIRFPHYPAFIEYKRNCYHFSWFYTKPAIFAKTWQSADPGKPFQCNNDFNISENEISSVWFMESPGRACYYYTVIYPLVLNDVYIEHFSCSTNKSHGCLMQGTILDMNMNYSKEIH
jgi:hypothetical protein